MPQLKQLSCAIEWANTSAPFQEHATTYGDGVVETYIAIPEHPQPFTIHLSSKGFIAEGLAMLVFIDGTYQCSRNRVNLKPLRNGAPRNQTELDLRVRQKEILIGDETFLGRAWRFDQHNIVPTQQIPSSVDENHFKELGTIEIIVLRCKATNLLQNPGSPSPFTDCSPLLRGGEFDFVQPTRGRPSQNNSYGRKATVEAVEEELLPDKSLNVRADGDGDFLHGFGLDGEAPPAGYWSWANKPEPPPARAAAAGPTQNWAPNQWGSGWAQQQNSDNGDQQSTYGRPWQGGIPNGQPKRVHFEYRDQPGSRSIRDHAANGGWRSTGQDANHHYAYPTPEQQAWRGGKPQPPKDPPRWIPNSTPETANWQPINHGFAENPRQNYPSQFEHHQPDWNCLPFPPPPPVVVPRNGSATIGYSGPDDASWAPAPNHAVLNPPAYNGGWHSLHGPGLDHYAVPPSLPPSIPPSIPTSIPPFHLVNPYWVQGPGMFADHPVSNSGAGVQQAEKNPGEKAGSKSPAKDETNPNASNSCSDDEKKNGNASDGSKVDEWANPVDNNASDQGNGSTNWENQNNQDENGTGANDWPDNNNDDAANNNDSNSWAADNPSTENNALQSDNDWQNDNSKNNNGTNDQTQPATGGAWDTNIAQPKPLASDTWNGKNNNTNIIQPQSSTLQSWKVAGASNGINHLQPAKGGPPSLFQPRSLHGPHGPYYAIQTSRSVEFRADVEEEPRYDVPESIAVARGSTRQVQPGQGYVYWHKCFSPEYIDNPEEPYARFVFKYRTKDQIEREIGLKIEDTPTSNQAKRRLQDMSKDEVIEILLRAQTALGGDVPSPPPKQADAARNDSPFVSTPIPAPDTSFLKYSMPGPQYFRTTPEGVGLGVLNAGIGPGNSSLPPDQGPQLYGNWRPVGNPPASLAPQTEQLPAWGSTGNQYQVQNQPQDRIDPDGFGLGGSPPAGAAGGGPANWAAEAQANFSGGASAPTHNW